MLNNPLANHELKHALASCQYKHMFVFAGLGFCLHSNNESIIEGLKEYYKSYFASTVEQKVVDVYVVEQGVVGAALDWLPVPREIGKTGRKEGYIDSPSGRWIKKFKTGLALLQRQRDPVAVGPCVKNLAQIVNFINNQFINVHLREGCLLGHASAFSKEGQVTAIAAGSGGGKSTLMLRCLEDDSTHFISNDRILLQRNEAGVTLTGVAKLPRVNPGTLLHSSGGRLKHILPVQEQERLQQLDQSTLWQLEQKYDVQIEDEYGPERVVLTGQLTRLIMLDWSLGSKVPTQIERVDLQQGLAHIEGLRKRPGPFYQDSTGQFIELTECADLEDYQQVLEGIAVYRLFGAVDFDKAVDLLASTEEI
ncbi:HprK-related kinase B [Marinomonas epiphytica]